MPSSLPHAVRQARDRNATSLVVQVMTDERARRLAVNETRMREINEQIQGTAQRFGGRHLYEFICECSRAGCMDRMRMTIEDYEELRQTAERFAVLAGHEEPEISSTFSSTASNPSRFAIAIDGRLVLRIRS